MHTVEGGGRMRAGVTGLQPVKNVNRGPIERSTLDNV